MNLGKLFKSAQRIVDKRGGTDALEDDAMELKDIVSSKGSLTEKAKEAGEALKDPGAPGEPAKAKQPAKPTAGTEKRPTA
jgi:hypothetical protein